MLKEQLLRNSKSAVLTRCKALVVSYSTQDDVFLS
jgi:hypothetical protein